MKRFSWLTTLVCLLSTSGVYAQQYRPVEPRYGDEYRNFQQGWDGSGRPVRPVHYQDGLKLEGQADSWPVNSYSNQSANAADASRAVAGQLRQQYQAGPNQPELQHSQGQGPNYYPAIPGNPSDFADGRPRSTVAEPARYSRPAGRSQEGQSTDAAPSPSNGQMQAPAQPPQTMNQPCQPMQPSQQPHGDCGQSYDQGCGPGYGSSDCGAGGCDDGYGHQGHGGRFRARRGMGMGSYADGGCYGPSDHGDGSCGTGYDGQGYYDDGYRTGRGPGSGGSRISQLFNKCGRDVYTVVGARWLYMQRVGSSFRELSYENPMPTNRLLVSDADLGHQHGAEVFVVRQDDCGQGWEGRYWGLASQTNAATLGNMPITRLTGLSLVNIGPWGTAGGLFNTADYHRIQRSSEFHNFEWNLINHASVCANNNWLYRGIFGVRVMRFRDALQYSAHSASGFGALGFNAVNYNILTRNTFVGAQAGGSGEYCVTDKLRLGVGANAGIGTNFIEADQTIANSNGVVGVVPGFGNYSVMNDDNNLAAFGEFDARMYYHVSCNWRLSVGYRVLGLAGVALAQDQIPNAVSDLSYVKRDGGLLLHGLTMGAEFSY